MMCGTPDRDGLHWPLPTGLGQAAFTHADRTAAAAEPADTCCSGCTPDAQRGIARRVATGSARPAPAHAHVHAHAHVTSSLSCACNADTQPTRTDRCIQSTGLL